MPQNGISTIKPEDGQLLEKNGLNEAERFEEEEQIVEIQRDTWGRSIEFLMSILSLSVGLGNLWRFPYVCFKHGGAAFLIPYVIILVLVGKPFYFLEMVLGQFTSKGSIKAMEMLPIMKGIGWGQQIGSGLISTYYTAIIGMTLTYFIKSFAKEFPWNTCDNFSNISTCIASKSNIIGSNNSVMSVELFLNRDVLDKKTDVSDGVGSLVGSLIITLFISWFCVFISIVKGIKTSGKVAYVFAILPYVILVSMLSYVCTLEGASDGLKELVIPKWEKLFVLDTWFAACTQCFYSLTIGMGCIITFSGYNKFTHNIYRDATIISVMDTFTSMLGASVIFAVLGNLKHSYGPQATFEEIASKSGVDLVFVTFPDAFSKIDAAFGVKTYYIPQMMAIVFFFMLFVLGVGSSVGLMSNLATNIKDFFPKAKFWQVAAVSCSTGFLIGLLYVTQGGMSMIGIVDFFGGEFLVFTMATLEIISIIWLYGLQNICWDVEFMLKIKLSPYWRICWGVIMPIFMIILWGSYVVNFNQNEGKPLYALVLGWGIYIIGLLQIVVCAMYLYLIKPFEIRTSFFSYLFAPGNKWGPKKLKTREEWREFKEDKEKHRQVMIFNKGHSWLQQKWNELLGNY